MKKYYHVLNLFKRSALEIISNCPWSVVEDCSEAYEQKYLPEDVYFQIRHGKKAFDLISFYEGASVKFYSERFIEVLSEFVDMSDKCYQIRIKDFEEQRYYVIHNLKEYNHFNSYEAFFGTPREPTMFFANDEPMPHIFTFYESRAIIKDETVKEAMVKAKLTNIRFKEIFGCTQEEYEEWKLNHLKTDSLKS